MKWCHTHQLVINKYKHRVKEAVLSHLSKYVVIFKFFRMVSSTCAFKNALPPDDRNSFKFIRAEGAKVCPLSSRCTIPLVTLGRLQNLLVISL